MPKDNMLTVLAARNGFTVRTASGTYVCKTIPELLREVESYAKVLQKNVAAEVKA